MGVGVARPGRAITMDDVVHIVARDLGEHEAGRPRATSPTPRRRVVVRQTDRLEQAEVGVAEQQVGGAV